MELIKVGRLTKIVISLIVILVRLVAEPSAVIMVIIGKIIKLTAIADI